MEIKRLKIKIKIKWQENLTRNQKWGILKYLYAEISFEKSEIIQDKRTHVSVILGQKMGYDRCPYLSFFVRRFEDEIRDLTGRRDLNTEVHHFWPKMLRKCLWWSYECRTAKMIWLG